jgi:transcriptional regulator with XRE-family HTH domain
MEGAVEPPQTPVQDPIDAAIGRTIQVLRTSRGMSRRGLATRASISYSYLSAIENGDKRPSSKILALIANALGVYAHELMAAAESRAAEARDDETDVAEATEMDTLLERLEERRMSRQLARLGYVVPTTPLRSELGAVEELRALIVQMDAADVDLVMEMARRLARG